MNPYESPLTDASLELKEKYVPVDEKVEEETPLMKWSGKLATVFFFISFGFGAALIKDSGSLWLLPTTIGICVVWVVFVVIYIVASIMQGSKSI